jgi:predicted amidohydrolase YtcJ
MADMVILQKDIMDIEIDAVPRVKVVATILNGDIVYQKTNY